MKRPDLDTLACVNAECQLFCQAGQGNLVVRKTYGCDELRLLRCRRCGEEFSERRGTALFNTKVSEAKASAVIDHLGEGCSVSSTARLTKVCKATVARLLRVSGRHAERSHDQHVHGVTPRAVEFDEQWAFVKKSKSAVDWPGLAQVFQLKRQVISKKTGAVRQEVVMGVTSLAAERADAARVLALVRGHWHIENKSHWVRDVTFDEDRSQVRCGNIPQVMAALRNTVIGLMRQAGETNIAAACRRFAAQPALALELIGIQLEN